MPPLVSASFSGSDLVKSQYKKITQAQKDKAAKAIEACARATYALSQKYVPIEFGDLKKSGRVGRFTAGSSRYEWRVTYGGPGVPYATYVHEILRYRHAPPTKARFLADSVTELRSNGTYKEIFRKTFKGEVDFFTAA